MSQKVDVEWRHLRYVTVRDVLSESKEFFVVWFIATSCTLILYSVFDVGSHLTGINDKAIKSLLPKWLWQALIVGAIFWYMKGREIRFKFPVLGSKGWFVGADLKLTRIWLPC